MPLVKKGFPRRKDNGAPESNMMQGFKNEENERRKVPDDLTIVKDEIEKQWRWAATVQ